MTTRYFFLDGSKIADKESFFKAIALAMDFPDYFGHNWDAFAECINDLSWIEEERKILIWVDPTDFRNNHPDDFKLAASLIIDACKSGKFKIHNLTTAMMSLIQYV
jgi:RNAse (barnase) inhibitor barstar